MEKKFRVIIEDGGKQHTIDCEHLAEAIQEYRKALDNYEQSKITLARVITE